MNFERKKDFFVGIDSDGTAFDSMTIKHTHAFIPAMVKLWSLESCRDTVKRIGARINLYSKERGINRFPGLVRTFDELREELGTKFPVEDYEGLREFVESNYPMSNGGLEAYRKENSSPILDQVLDWSRMADKIFVEAVQNLPPFNGVHDTLKEMAKTADLMVVSAAAYDGLMKDWGREGLLETVDFVAGQELGDKKKQLEFALKTGYEKEKCLMIGDGIGDLDAAKANGICFYPMIPTREERCWAELRNKYYSIFLKGEYAGELEESLITAFKQFLEKGR